MPKPSPVEPEKPKHCLLSFPRIKDIPQCDKPIRFAFLKSGATELEGSQTTRLTKWQQVQAYDLPSESTILKSCDDACEEYAFKHILIENPPGKQLIKNPPTLTLVPIWLQCTLNQERSRKNQALASYTFYNNSSISNNFKCDLIGVTQFVVDHQKTATKFVSEAAFEVSVEFPSGKLAVIRNLTGKLTIDDHCEKHKTIKKKRLNAWETGTVEMCADYLVYEIVAGFQAIITGEILASDEDGQCKVFNLETLLPKTYINFEQKFLLSRGTNIRSYFHKRPRIIDYSESDKDVEPVFVSECWK